MEEIVSAGVKAAAAGAETGNMGALLVFVLLLGAFIVVLLGVALIKERGKRHDDPPPPACPPPGGCPEVSKISAHVEALTRELKRDGEDRREHRQEVRESIARVHERLDEAPTRQEMVSIATISQHAQEEMSRGLAALTAIAESIKSAPARRRAAPKRSA